MFCTIFFMFRPLFLDLLAILLELNESNQKRKEPKLYNRPRIYTYTISTHVFSFKQCSIISAEKFAVDESKLELLHIEIEEEQEEVCARDEMARKY